MRKQSAIRVAVAAALATLAGGAQAISFTANNWTLDINGTINAFYVQGEQKDTVGATTTTTDQANIQNGLLPGWINFVATTKQRDWDVKAHVSFAPGIQNNSQIVGLPNGATVDLADAYSKVDSRNVYFQFGRSGTGTFKFGRDIGLFMQNPILADMTLLGVGGTVRAAEPYNTSFGMIGHGYMYVGFQPQITYSNSFKTGPGGFDFSVGLFNPSFYDPAQGTEKKTPQIQALGSLSWGGPLAGKAWLSTVYNKTDGTTANPGRKADGFEGGVKMNLGNPNLEGVLSAFRAKGLGISTIGAQFLVIDDTTGGRLESDGHFAQLTFKPVPDWKLGVSYGQNKDKQLTSLGDAKRKAYAFGVYHTFLPAVTLVGEYINEKGTNLLGGVNTQKANSISLGAIIFF